MAEKKKMRNSAEVILDKIADLCNRFPAIKKEKVLIDFVKWLKAHSAEFTRNVTESFREMVKTRQAAKFYGVDEETFKAQIAAYIAQQQEIFRRAQTLTKDDLSRVEKMTAKAKATKKAKETDLDDLTAMLK